MSYFFFFFFKQYTQPAKHTPSDCEYGYAYVYVTLNG
jgi:hypothetical protein